jgi:hypothetical protein
VIGAVIFIDLLVKGLSEVVRIVVGEVKNVPTFVELVPDTVMPVIILFLTAELTFELLGEFFTVTEGVTCPAMDLVV